MTVSVHVKEVAKAANVAVPTAYEALRGAGRLSDQTRQRVFDAARKLGYRANLGARATRTGRMNAVGLLMSLDRKRRYMPADLLEGIHDTLALRDYHLTYAKLPDEKLTDSGFVPKILREWSVDGLLINYTHDFPQQMTDLIDRYRIPCIWLNNKRDHDAVYPDDEAAGRQATEYLLRQGLSRITYLMLVRPGSAAHDSVAQRAAGYRTAMLQAGRQPSIVELPVDEVWEPGKTFIDTRLQVLRHWLTSTQRPQGIVTYSSWTAEPLLYAALSLGLNIPGDLRLVNLAGLSPTTSFGITLTQMQLNLHDLGQAAVNLLLRKLDEQGQNQSSISLPMQLVSGQT